MIRRAILRWAGPIYAVTITAAVVLVVPLAIMSDPYHH